MKEAKCVFLMFFILFLSFFSLNVNSTYPSTYSLEPVSDSADDPLKIGTTSLGYDLDPAFADDMASLDIVDQVWEGLYAHNFGDPKLRIIPRLAADCGSWNENATVFNVTLRSGITFHNGKDFTAADVNYTFSRLWELCVFHNSQMRAAYFPKGFNTTKMNVSVGYGYIINKTVIVDDLHVSFELNFPYAPFQSLLCFSGSYIVDESTTTTDTFLNIANQTAIGTGPYRITEHNTEQCTFEYWENYYRGTPAIKKIIFVKSLSSDTISQSLLNGEFDIARIYGSDFMDDFEESENIYVGPYREESIISFISMNNRKIDRTLRHAINYAIDYDKIINERNILYHRKDSRMTSIIPPGIPYHKECIIPILNITKARQILIEAGYTDGNGLDENSSDQSWIDVAESTNSILRFEYVYNWGSINRENIGILIQDNLKMIGIRVDMAGSPWYLWIDSFEDLEGNGGRNYMYYSGFIPAYNDPSHVIKLLMSNTSSANYAQVNDPWLQNAMEEAVTIIDEDDRKALYYEIQDYIATDLMPLVFLGNVWSREVHSNHVIPQPNPMDKLYIFPFSWHGVNTTFNDPYLELWCNSGSPPVLEYWPEPQESIPSYPIIVFSICILVIIPLWLKKCKKKPKI